MFATLRKSYTYYAVLFLVFVLSVVYAQEGGDGNTQGGAQGAGEQGDDDNSSVGTEITPRNFDFNVGGDFDRSREIDDDDFQRCRTNRRFCSNFNRRIFFSCEGGMFVLNRCPRGTVCRYSFGQQECQRLLL